MGTELTRAERYVLGEVQSWHAHHGGAVGTSYARGSGRVVSYDQTTRALRSLVAKGLLSKPRRGYYVPVEEVVGDDER